MENATPWTGTPAPPGAKNPYSGQWNWGAFFWQWIWLLAHRRIGLAILAFILAFIPLGGLVFGIWLGVKGNDLAIEKRPFSSDEQYVAVQNAWRNWGFGLLGVIVVIVLASAIISATVHAR